MKQHILEMEQYAIDNNIPIIEKSSIAFIMKYIKNNNVLNVLEIGSAIGYSAIQMAMINPDIKITTIERNKALYNEAIKNVKAFDLTKQITIINGDALDEFDKIG